MQPGPPNFLREPTLRAGVGPARWGVFAMKSFRSFAVAPAALAVASLVATPAAAAEMPSLVLAKPVEAMPALAPGDDASDYHRRYRYRRHRGVDAGDVLAGVLIIGGIAAIANAAKNADSRRYRDRDYRYRDYRNRDDRRTDYRQEYDARGIDRAVEMCADEIERNARIDSVDAVNRTASGWQVTGSLYNGEGFFCSIGQDGRIEAIDYGRSGATWQADDAAQDYSAQAPVDDRQYDEDYYASARARVDGQPAPEVQPTYPGGPVEGDAGDDGGLEYGNGYRGAGA